MEEWKKINNFPDYEISSLGRVKSLKRGGEKIMSLKTDRMKYKFIHFCKDGKQTTPKRVHRLVAEAFIPLVEGKDFIDHINRIKDDNRVENLRWVNKSENNRNIEDREGRDRYIYKHNQLYRVRIRQMGKTLMDSCYETLDEAIKERDEFLH